jgi:hypothetical protein
MRDGSHERNAQLAVTYLHSGGLVVGCVMREKAAENVTKAFIGGAREQRRNSVVILK